jgi:hypothetical protein
MLIVVNKDIENVYYNQHYVAFVAVVIVREARHSVRVNLQAQEYEAFIGGFKSTLYKKKSHYARKLLLRQPVTMVYRNRSLDDLIEMGVGLRKDLRLLLSREVLSAAEKEELNKKVISIQERLIQLVDICNHISSQNNTF